MSRNTLHLVIEVEREISRLAVVCLICHENRKCDNFTCFIFFSEKARNGSIVLKCVPHVLIYQIGSIKFLICGVVFDVVVIDSALTILRLKRFGVGKNEKENKICGQALIRCPHNYKTDTRDVLQ